MADQAGVNARTGTVSTVAQTDARRDRSRRTRQLVDAYRATGERRHRRADAGHGALESQVDPGGDAGAAVLQHRRTAVESRRSHAAGAATLAVFRWFPSVTPWLRLPALIIVFAFFSLAIGLFRCGELSHELTRMMRRA